MIAGPNEILETHFVQGRDMLTYQSEDQLVAMLEDVFAGRLQLDAMASHGRERALARFPSIAIVETIISVWHRSTLRDPTCDVGDGKGSSKN